ncbi:allantoate permease [Fusarium denticulatum]|uniref:Allantoate permease n=1 Tax=Fusarium denticulatum TaxID=48507 RepID=A0A8H5T9R6_9HYPO|nr:allantoate permease [Fusarium denticulatum]
MPKKVNDGDVAAAPEAEHADHIGNITPVKETDKAALFLKKMSVTGPIIFTPEEEKAVLRKIDWRILPLILIAYFFQQLDKSTLSYSSVFDITTDANLHGTHFSWLGSSLYLAQLVAQPLAALTLVKLPTGKVIAGAIFLWAPSLIAVTQMWWKRNEQTLRTSYWSAINGLTFIIGISSHSDLVTSRAALSSPTRCAPLLGLVGSPPDSAISVYPRITPLIFAWEAQNTAGDTKRKVTSGVMFVGLCTGNVIGPLLYRTDQAPLYRQGHISNLCLFILVIILTARLALGKSEVIVDRSMLQSSVAAELESNEEMVAHDHDFEDMTDLKNEDFIFVH